MQFAIIGKKHFRNLAAAIAASTFALLAACGGGGGGGGAAPTPGPLATGTFTKTTSAATSGNNIIPFGTGSFGDVKSHNLYASTLVGGSGRITMLRYKRAEAMAAAVTCPNTTVRFGHTNLAALTTTFGSNVNTGQGSQLAVYTNATLTIPAGAVDTFFDIPLATPFEYNGVDNLVVEVERTTTCSADAAVRTVTLAGARAVATATDTVAGTAQHNQTTGNVDTVQPIMQFVFAGGDNSVIAADRAGNNGNSFAPASQGRAQFLILASDIVGSGPITGIQFTANAALAAPMTATYKVTLSHVAPATTTIGSTTFATNVGTNSTVVAQAVSVSLPTGTTEWWTPLTGSFSYDGTSNLLVDVEATAVTGGFSVRYQNIVGSRIMAGADPAAATGSLFPRGLEPKLRFNGSTVDRVIGLGGTDAARWFTANGTGAVDQYLYLDNELGTGGSINRMACRKGSAGATVATSYANFEVVLSHTTADTLGVTYAANLPTPVTVFNGTFNLPAGLQQGDWIEIPFTSAFNYNADQNLVIQVKSDAGATAHNCSVLADARFTSRRTSGGVRTGASGEALFDHQKDIRLSVNN